MDSEWEERQKTRQLEMQACSKALAFLSSDEAHDLFSKTFALVQTKSTTKSKHRSEASKLLYRAAKKGRNPRLVALAYRTQLDSFKKVNEAIDDMSADLEEQEKEEIKHKDFCVEEFNSNTLATEKAGYRKEKLTATSEDLANTIESLKIAIETLKSEITELQAEMKKAGEDREVQNKEFQTTVADQRATQKLLTKAKEVLEGFYGKKAAAFMQGLQPAPPGFSSYKKNAASGGVMGMIQEIIDEAKTMEAEATRSEEEAQKAYDDFVMETKTSIDTKTKDITNKTEEKAKAEADKVEAADDKETVVIQLETLTNYNNELHQSCDFTVKNFETRQTARDEEVEALRQAMAILSGAKFESFLQY